MTTKDVVSDPKDMAVIEALIDRYSLANVVEALVAICGEKADHIESNWQDADLARDWTTDARLLDRVICKLRNAG